MSKGKKLLDILDIVNDGLSKEDFEKAFKVVLDYVQNMDKRNVKDLEALRHFLTNLATKVETKSDQSLEDIKFEVSKQVDNFMKMVEAKIVSIVEGAKGEPGDAGYTPIKGTDYFDGLPGSPDTPEEIVDKLESLDGDARLNMSAIDGLKEALEELRKLKGKVILGGGGGASGGKIVKTYDLSPSLNGVLSTFTLPAFYRIHLVQSSSFPYGAARETVDWTSDARAMTITFTSQIDPSTQLATGQSLIILYSEA